MDIGVLKQKPTFAVSSKTLWGEDYKYYRMKLKCILLGESFNKEIFLKCELVKYWCKSPQFSNYKDRMALIGRNLLLDNKVKLLLDGKNKKYDVME